MEMSEQAKEAVDSLAKAVTEEQYRLALFALPPEIANVEAAVQLWEIKNFANELCTRVHVLTEALQKAPTLIGEPLSAVTESVATPTMIQDLFTALEITQTLEKLNTVEKKQTQELQRLIASRLKNILGG